MNTHTAVPNAFARSGRRLPFALPARASQVGRSVLLAFASLAVLPGITALPSLPALPGLVGAPARLAAQQGTITYTHTRKVELDLPPGAMPARNMERMREAMQAGATRAVTLQFTPSASLMTTGTGEAGDAQAMGNRFRSVVRAEAIRGRGDAIRMRDIPPGAFAAMGMFGGMGGDQVLATYADHTAGTLVETREFMGRKFRVASPLPKIEWRMTSEQAEHLGRMVIKATATVEREVSARGFARQGGLGRAPGGDRSGAANRSRAANQNEARDRAARRSGEGGPDGAEAPPDQPQTREVAIEAWFAPEIPASAGPAGYGGLPGMILVLSEDDGRVQYAATEIAMGGEGSGGSSGQGDAGSSGQGTGGSDAAAGNIRPPEEGDLLTREDYDQMVREKIEELRRTRRPPPGGGEGN